MGVKWRNTHCTLQQYFHGTYFRKLPYTKDKTFWGVRGEGNGNLFQYPCLENPMDG